MNNSESKESEKVDLRLARSERTKKKLIIAAMRCYRDIGVSATSMDQVALEAGVGRATLYRHFKSQDVLLAEVMTENILQLQGLLKTSLDDCDKPEDFLVEAALLIIRESHKRSLTTLFFNETTQSKANKISFTDKQLMAIGDELLEPFFKRAKTEDILRDWVTLPLLQEWISRLLLSFLTNPSKQLKSEKKLRAFFYDAIVPSIIDRS